MICKARQRNLLTSRPSPNAASIADLSRANICEMPQTSSLQIRTVTRGDLDLLVEWAAGEGWNPGLADADCFYAADPAGFLIACINNEPIGCISVVTYKSAFAFLGFISSNLSCAGEDTV